MERERMMIVVDFDRHAFRYTRNRNDRKVGDRILLDQDKWYIVYCLLDVDHYQNDKICELFQRGFRNRDFFCDKLNEAVEEILWSISEKQIDAYKKVRAARQLKETKMLEALVDAFQRYGLRNDVR